MEFFFKFEWLRLKFQQRIINERSIINRKSKIDKNKAKYIIKINNPRVCDEINKKKIIFNLIIYFQRTKK